MSEGSAVKKMVTPAAKRVNGGRIPGQRDMALLCDQAEGSRIDVRLRRAPVAAPPVGNRPPTPTSRSCHNARAVQIPLNLQPV